LTDVRQRGGRYDAVHALRRFERRDGNRTGASVQDKEEFPEQQYERKGTSTMSCVLLAVLVAVVGLIAVMAARTGA
jgi:hypothetical protein